MNYSIYFIISCTGIHNQIRLLLQYSVFECQTTYVLSVESPEVVNPLISPLPIHTSKDESRSYNNSKICCRYNLIQRSVILRVHV